MRNTINAIIYLVQRIYSDYDAPLVNKDRGLDVISQTNSQFHPQFRLHLFRIQYPSCVQLVCSLDTSTLAAAVSATENDLASLQ